MTVGDIRKQLEGLPDGMLVCLQMENNPPDNLSVTFHGFSTIDKSTRCLMWVSIDNSEDYDSVLDDEDD